jgi:hypothetical protein
MPDGATGWRRAGAALGRAALPAALLLAAQAALLTHTAWVKSDTADEPVYIATAFNQWDRLDFTSNCESPALPKWGFALALRFCDPRLFDATIVQGRDPLWSRPLPQTRRNLFAARLATIVVTLAGGLLLYLAAVRFGRGAGLVTLALWCFSPTMLANGSLATLDPWATAFTCAALWAAVRLFERPNAARAAALGVALALAAACKVTTLGLLPVALGVMVAAARRGGASWAPRLSRLTAAAAVAFALSLWAVYGFTFATLRTDTLCGKPAEGLGAHAFGPLPFTPWLEGLLTQVLHGRKGHRSYLFGEVGFHGWWWFYLAALALKTTLGAQGLALLRAASWLRPAGRRGWRVDAALLAFPLLLVAVMSAGRTQNGIKYILPAFPLLMVVGGRALESARPAFGRRGAAAAIALVAVGAVESLAVHPHHLMFFNLWAGGPRGGPRYLIHGDDWGQDQRLLAEWQKHNRPWKLYYTYYNGNPHHWGVFYRKPPCEPRPGWYALQAIEVHRPKRTPPGCLDWLTVEEPDARLGFSIYLYLVNKARIERLVAERGRVRPFWSSAQAVGPDDDDDGVEDAAPDSGVSP